MKDSGKTEVKNYIDTPFGRLYVCFKDQKISKIGLEHCSFESFPDFLSELIYDFQRYFNGQKVDFKRYPLNLERISEFRKRVYTHLREKLPYGKVTTYGNLAKELGTSPRAIGQALAKNPFLIVVPCHRVVSKNGSGGFSLGPEIKRFLLNLEGGI